MEDYMYNSYNVQKQISDFEGIKIKIPEGMKFKKAWDSIFKKQLLLNSTVKDFKERYEAFIKESLIQ